MTEASTSAANQLTDNPGLKRYWENLTAHRATVDPTLLGTSEIAVVYIAGGGTGAGTVAGSTQGGVAQDGAAQDSVGHA